jgi:hypothetical protein
MSNQPADLQEALRRDLRFELTLRHDGPETAWHAELAASPTGPRLHFESLPELMRYLARLDLHVPPARGIR